MKIELINREYWIKKIEEEEIIKNWFKIKKNP